LLNSYPLPATRQGLATCVQSSCAERAGHFAASMTQTKDSADPFREGRGALFKILVDGFFPSPLFLCHNMRHLSTLMAFLKKDAGRSLLLCDAHRPSPLSVDIDTRDPRRLGLPLEQNFLVQLKSGSDDFPPLTPALPNDANHVFL